MKTRLLGLAATLTVLSALLTWTGPPARASAAGGGYTATTMTWTVHVGPRRATTCTLVGELFVPDGASAAHRQPAILTTNGFGGSYRDQVSLARYFAGTQGYVVVAYSGLGFGGSGCNIELDSPIWDGQAASQLVTWLAGQPEVALDHPGDPKVGMIGGSYGGAVQLAAASIDPRIDAIVPVITWNDLGYSLAPQNNAPGLGFTDSPPGVLKAEWTAFFFAEGATTPLQHPTVTPFPPSTCPGYDPVLCPELATSALDGYPSAATLATLRASSMVTYGRSVHAPTLLMQGEDDTLFNIDEAVANDNQLRANGAPVKLVIQSWGHSNGGKPAPGELDFADPAHPGYEATLVDRWFARYLRGQRVATGPSVEYFRPWVAYQGSARPAYGSASSWPVGRDLPLYLSGAGDGLVSAPSRVGAGRQTFFNPPAGLPTSYSETSAVQFLPPFSQIPPTDVPGTFASYQTPPLVANIDSVGIPTLHFTLDSSIPGTTPASDPVVFAKIYDVAPDGTVTLADRIVSPVRIATPGQPVTITLPGVVHRYPSGHRVRLVVAATDAAYLGNRLPEVLSIAVDPAHPPVLDLPTVDGSTHPPAVTGPAALPPRAVVPGAVVPAAVTPAAVRPGSPPAATTMVPSGATLAVTGSPLLRDALWGLGAVALGSLAVVGAGAGVTRRRTRTDRE